MKIKINLNIFLILIVFFITKQIKLYAYTMIFTLIHELGHLFMGLILGYKIENFIIKPIGFSIEFKTKIDEYNKKILKSSKISLNKILIASAGPLVNLCIILILYSIKSNLNLIYVNVIIFLFNLLPIYPLDGGRIILNLLKIFFGNKKAYTYTNNISNSFMILITTVFSILIYRYKNIAILIVIIFLWVLIIKENKKYKIYHKIYQTIDK